MTKFPIILVFVSLFFSFSSSILAFFDDGKKEINFEQENKGIVLIDDGLVFRIGTNAGTVEEFTKEQGIILEEKDIIIPSLDAKLYSGMDVNIQRMKKISVMDGKNKSEIIALGKNVADALWENNIKLGEDDIIDPKPHFPLGENNKIEIVRVDITEEIVGKAIDFKKTSEEDDELSWRIKKVKQKGIKGKEEIKYRVVAHNGKEISRKIIERKVVEEPVPEITVQGTYVKLGKSHSGAASWYNFTGELTAANPWLPMGSYVKVTNKENGKSVIVKIVDRGPFGPGRIIDLEKVAFAKIAGIGEGIIDIKMEEILN